VRCHKTRANGWTCRLLPPAGRRAARAALPALQTQGGQVAELTILQAHSPAGRALNPAVCANSATKSLSTQGSRHHNRVFNLWPPREEATYIVV